MVVVKGKDGVRYRWGGRVASLLWQTNSEIDEVLTVHGTKGPWRPRPLLLARLALTHPTASTNAPGRMELSPGHTPTKIVLRVNTTRCASLIRTRATATELAADLMLLVSQRQLRRNRDGVCSAEAQVSNPDQLPGQRRLRLRGRRGRGSCPPLSTYRPRVLPLSTSAAPGPCALAGDQGYFGREAVLRALPDRGIARHHGDLRRDLVSNRTLCAHARAYECLILYM